MLLEDNGFIRDLQAAALVDRDGAVDWLCLPRLDSASCFSALLGDERQGEISGLSRSVSNLGSSFGTAIAGTILVSVVATGNRSYALAMASLVVFGLAGLGAAWFLPGNLKRQAH